MSEFWKNDYAVNKKEKSSIIYQTVTGERIVITKERFLKENPDKKEKDFYEIKKYSDEDYRVRCNKDHYEERNSTELLEEAVTSEVCESPEDLIFNMIHEKEFGEILAKFLEKELSLIQKERLFMYAEGKTMREIAAIEGVSFVAVSKSITLIRKKFEEFLKKFNFQG
ncbi:hypothetical protein [Tropicimonas sp.]|uniref:hypothetical protein n=1 Tax=Tropicimonas sp. TaxID=2067044 RepID=UPI003A89E844